MSGSAISQSKHYFGSIRNAGSRGRKGTPGEGMVFGGIYYPRHRKPDGQVNQARWESSFYINHPPYTDRNTGQKVPGRTEIIRLIAWNGENAERGRGLGDIMAKAMGPGKELTCWCDLRTYPRRVYDNNNRLILQPDGSPLMITGMIKFHLQGGEFMFGADSHKFITAEIQDALRPVNWNNPAHQDNLIWQQICRERNAEIWEGLPKYGYAQVLAPSNDVALECPLQNVAIPRCRIFTPTIYNNEINTNNNFGPANNNFGPTNAPANSGFTRSAAPANNGFGPVSAPAPNNNFGVAQEHHYAHPSAAPVNAGFANPVSTGRVMF